MKRMICAALALVMTLVLLTSCGLFGVGNNPDGGNLDNKEAAVLRGTEVYKTKNYSINGMMMQFLANDSYFKLYKAVSELAELNDDTVKSAFKYHLELDIDSPFADQTFSGKGYDLLGKALEIGEAYKNFSGSWYDLFWNIASGEAKRILALCEMAGEAGLALDESDREMLKRELNVIKNETKKMHNVLYYVYNGVIQGGIVGSLVPSVSGGGDSYAPAASGSFAFEGFYNPAVSGDFNYSYNDVFRPIGSGDDTLHFNNAFTSSAYFSADITRVYGQGITDSDILGVLELKALAQKYYDSVAAEVREELSADSERVEAYFIENESSYRRAEYLTFSLIFNGESADEAVRLSEELMACESPDEFKAWVLEYLFELKWRDYYHSIIKDTLKENNGKEGDGVLREEDIPSDDVVAEKKADMLSGIASGLEEDLDEDKLCEIGNTAYDRVLRKVRQKIYPEIRAEYSEMHVKYGKQNEKSEIDRWIFSEDRVAGEKTGIIPAEMKAGSEIKVVYLIKPAYVDNRATVSFGEIKIPYDFYNSKNDAFKAADEIMSQLKLGELTEDSFKAFAAEKTNGTEIFFDSVIPYSVGNAVSEWLFDGQRAVGDLEMIRDKDGYHIVYVTGVSGDTVSDVNVINDIVEEEMEARVASILAASEAEYIGDSVKEKVSIPVKKPNVTSASGGDSASESGIIGPVTNPAIEYIKPIN